MLESLLIPAAIIMSQSPTPRSGEASPRAGPYTIAEERSVPTVAPTLASQVQEALMLGHDVSMSVVVEQVEHVPVPETPPIASGVDTPVQVFWKYSFHVVPSQHLSSRGSAENAGQAFSRLI